jgi:hypothetical protein
LHLRRSFLEKFNVFISIWIWDYSSLYSIQCFGRRILWEASRDWCEMKSGQMVVDTWCWCWLLRLKERWETMRVVWNFEKLLLIKHFGSDLRILIINTFCRPFADLFFFFMTSSHHHYLNGFSCAIFYMKGKGELRFLLNKKGLMKLFLKRWKSFICWTMEWEHSFMMEKKVDYFFSLIKKSGLKV